MQLLTLYFQRITLKLRLRHVDNPMHVERHLLRVRRPAFVAEAVRVPAVTGRGERIVIRRHGLFRVLAVVGGIEDLSIQFVSFPEFLSFVRRENGCVRRSQSPDSHSHQTPDRQPGTSPSSCHLGAAPRKSILQCLRAAGCCVQ